MQLTEQQIRYFETFGCLKFPGLFADDINAITDAFEQIYADVVAKDSSKAHDDKQRSQLGPDFVGQSAYLSSLIGDPRGGYVNRCVNDIRRRPSQPLIQWRFHPHTVHRDRRLRSTQGPSDA